jgi:predicted Zn-dependent peptidase
VSAKNKFKSKDVEFFKPDLTRRYEFGPHDDVILEKMFDYGNKESIFFVSNLMEEDIPYILFINQMLSSGLTSPLYQEVREKRGLVYYISMNMARMNKQGVNAIATQTTSDNVEELKDTVRYVLSNPDIFLTKDRLETIRESNLIRKKKEKITRFANVSKWVNPEGWSIQDILEDVTLTKLRNVYDKHFNIDDYYFSSSKDFLQ